MSLEVQRSFEIMNYGTKTWTVVSEETFARPLPARILSRALLTGSGLSAFMVHFANRSSFS